jgi:hypothetical protein
VIGFRTGSSGQRLITMGGFAYASCNALWITTREIL